jgi:hypothetical protein
MSANVRQRTPEGGKGQEGRDRRLLETGSAIKQGRIMIGAETSYARPEWQRQDFNNETAQRLPEEGGLEPLLEGARARGIADAFEMIGQAAMLVDAEGCVLHVNDAAIPFMGATIAVTKRHIVGGEDGATELLQATIASALAGKAAELIFDSKGLRERSVAVAMHVRVLPVPGAAGNSNQLVKAIVLLDAEEALGDGACEVSDEDDRQSASPWRGMRLSPLF